MDVIDRYFFFVLDIFYIYFFIDRLFMNEKFSSEEWVVGNESLLEFFLSFNIYYFYVIFRLSLGNN